MYGLRFAGREHENWIPRNSLERKIKEKNKKRYSSKHYNNGKAIYKALGCSCGRRNITSIGSKIKTSEEFLLASKVEEDNLFPIGFSKQEMKQIARHIYFKIQDKINIGQYIPLIEKYSFYDITEDNTESKRFYYIGKIAARLSRADINYLGIAELQKFYNKVQLNDKEDAFNTFNLYTGTMANMWGKDYYKKLGIGRIFVRMRTVYTGKEMNRITIREWQEKSIEGLEEKMHVFDALSLVGKPWIDALYLGTNLLAEYIRNLPE